MPGERDPRLTGFNFDLTTEQEPGRTRIAVRGELDIGTAPDVERALDDARDRGDAIDLDLRGLTFMDSTGVRLLIVAAQAQALDAAPLRMFLPSGGDALVALEETGAAALLPIATPDADGEGSPA